MMVYPRIVPHVDTALCLLNQSLYPFTAFCQLKSPQKQSISLEKERMSVEKIDRTICVKYVYVTYKNIYLEELYYVICTTVRV